MLSDTNIRTELTTNKLKIHPLTDTQIQPASIDLKLAETLIRFPETWQPHPIDPQHLPKHHGEKELLHPDGQTTLHANEFALAATMEHITLPNHLAARVEGKSSLGRLGLFVHVTAGFIDPGFRGTITLELYNASQYDLILRPGMLICQLSLYRLETPCERPYGSPGLGSHYQGQSVVTPSRYGQ